MTSSLSTPGVILFAHGARHAEWAKPFERIRDQFLNIHPDTPVELAFLELMHPNLLEAVGLLANKEVTDIMLVPLFLAQGGHLKKDLPRLIKEANNKYPGVVVVITEAIGENECILNTISAWIDEGYNKLFTHSITDN